MLKHIHELILGAGLIAAFCSAIPAEAAPPNKSATGKRGNLDKVGAKAPDTVSQDFARSRNSLAAIPPLTKPVSLEVVDSFKTFGLLQRYDDQMILIGHPLQGPSQEHMNAMKITTVTPDRIAMPGTFLAT